MKEAATSLGGQASPAPACCAAGVALESVYPADSKRATPVDVDDPEFLKLRAEIGSPARP